MLHARIAARAFNTPLLVEPSKAMAFLSGLGPRILGRKVALADHELPDVAGTTTLPARASLLSGGLTERALRHGDAPYAIVEDIAVIEICGVLIHRGGWIGQSSGQTSYEGIAAQIEAAASDPAVRGLALEIDSFGGEVAGVFDLADRIRAVRGTKPVWAFVAEHAFSAGYALASQADRILLPRTGALGSIGVMVLHADLSGHRRILLDMPTALRFRTITAATVEGHDHRLTLSSNLGETVPVSTKVHFLTLMRVDADRVEIQHGALASEVTVPVVEVGA